MRILRRRLVYALSILIIALGIAGCANQPFTGGSERPIPIMYGKNFNAGKLSIADPRSAIVVIYSHGVSDPQHEQPCWWWSYDAPATIKAMNSGRVYVMRHCSKATESDNDPAGEQVFRRKEELQIMMRGLKSMGVSPDRIYLAGHSNGGWTSLMLNADPKSYRPAGVIAFAPAFAGKLRSRKPRWVKAREDQVKAMTSGRRVRALVFAYENDPYYKVEHLRFLPKRFGKSVRLVAYDCGNSNPHRTHHHDCRAERTKELIRAFIR